MLQGSALSMVGLDAIVASTLGATEAFSPGLVARAYARGISATALNHFAFRCSDQQPASFPLCCASL